MSDCFAFRDLAAAQRYKMLCAAVVPRPIAWITTIDAAGVVNAAPFSFFNVFSEDPALVIVGMNRAAGRLKDTLVNIGRARAFTVNIADATQAHDLVASAAAYPSGTGEPDALGLPLGSPVANGVPHLAACPIALECSLFELRPLSPERHLVMGEVETLIAREGLFDRDTLRLDPAGFAPLARLHGAGYAALGARFDIPVPPPP